MSAARIVAILNLLFVAAAAVMMLRLYKDIGVASLWALTRSKTFLAVLGVSIVIAYLDAVFLGKGAGFTMHANKLSQTRGQVGNLSVFRGHFIHPESFEAFVFVYDPVLASFDNLMVTMYKNKVTRATGRVSMVGAVFPDDPTKRMISIYRLISGVDSYIQPRSTSPDFLRGVLVQFFLSSDGKTADQYSEAAARFNALPTIGKFMVRRNGRFQEIASV
jgi:hypothetical protein